MTKSNGQDRTSVFISYSHADSQWLQRLKVHLRPLERDLEIDIWDDTKITSGSKWREEIDVALSKAKVAVLLVSADFIASDFIHTNELPPLLSAAESEGARILPVIIAPSRFLRTEGLRDFQSVNAPSNPLMKMEKVDQEQIYVEITEYIETAMQSLEELPSKQTLKLEAAPLNRVPLIVYFEEIGEQKATNIYASLQARGMRPHQFGEGLGVAGSNTIAYSSAYYNAAIWLKEHIEFLNEFNVLSLGEDDPFEGIVVNLW